MFEQCLKHLIYIFVFVFIFSFVGMCYVVFNSDEDAIFEHDIYEDIKLKQWFVENNPVIYGLKKLKGKNSNHTYDNIDMATDALKFMSDKMVDNWK